MATTPTYAILRFQKHQGNPAKRIEDHHERNKAHYASNPDIDLHRSKEHFHIIKPNGGYYAEIQRRIEAAGCRTRKDSVRFIDTLVTASPTFFQRRSRSEIRSFFTAACAFLEQRLGRENIVSAVVHMDEKTPHMHMVFVPLTPDHRLCAKEIMGNRQKLTQWQDTFWSYMAERYPELERGESVSKTGREHIPTRLFKEAAHLSRQKDALMTLLGEANAFNAKDKRAQIAVLLEKYIPAVEKMQTRLKKYEKAFQALSTENAMLEKHLSSASKESIARQLEIAKELSAYETLKRAVQAIPQDILNTALSQQKDKTPTHCGKYR